MEESILAEVIYKAFVSCSLAEEDQEIVEVFKKTIRSFKIEPIVYDYQEIGGLSDKIKEHIVEVDCLIAIITRRDKIEGTNLWSGPTWIQHELALAHAFNKPIAIFVEEGVQIEGLIEMEERRNIFKRDDLFCNFDKIISFLFSLREYLEAASSHDIIASPAILKHYIRSKQEMVGNKYLVERTEIMMESLIDSLQSAFHRIEVEEMTESVSVKPESFEFRCLEKPSHTEVTHEILVNRESVFSWKVNFNPPLKKSEKVKYAYKKKGPLYNPYTYEELIKRIEAGTYEYKEPKCEACEWTISYPTYELHHDFEFPEDYEIREYYPDVVLGQEKVKAEEELKRVVDGNMFSAEKVFDKWILRLKVISHWLTINIILIMCHQKLTKSRMSKAP